MSDWQKFQEGFKNRGKAREKAKENMAATIEKRKRAVGKADEPIDPKEAEEKRRKSLGFQ